ncbi:MAG TPA: lasso peptide biosynthesis B2 protein [Candidatus Elarobacter sp.]|jgi:hypothetical protein
MPGDVAIDEDPPIPGRLVASADLFAGDVDGLTVLLDLRTERYFICDETASAMWRLLDELGDRAAVVAALARAYDGVAAAVLERDLDGFVARLLRDGFVCRADDARARPARRGVPARMRARARPSAARAWWWLLRTALRLRRAGFATAYRAGIAMEAFPYGPAPSGDELDAAVRAFERAENAFVLRNAPRDCFPRSMALFCFLRELGFPVQHRIGVTRYPFSAHAYVALGERVLCDHHAQARARATIAAIPA